MRPLSRREVLVAVGGLTVVGSVAACAGSGDPTVTAASAPNDTARVDSAGSERALIDAYDQSMSTYPSLAEALRPIRDQHAEHLSALAIDAEPSSPFTVPATDTATLDALRGLERTAARSRRSSCIATTDAELARLLTSIAASEASHAPALKRLAAS